MYAGWRFLRYLGDILFRPLSMWETYIFLISEERKESPNLMHNVLPVLKAEVLLNKDAGDLKCKFF